MFILLRLLLFYNITELQLVDVKEKGLSIAIGADFLKQFSSFQ